MISSLDWCPTSFDGFPDELDMLPDVSPPLTGGFSRGNDSVSCAEAKSLKCTWGGSNTLGMCVCVCLADATLFCGEDIDKESSLAVCEPKVRAGVKVSSVSVSGGISSNSSSSSGKGLLNIQLATVEL